MMGIFRSHNTRDTSNPDGARHAAHESEAQKADAGKPELVRGYLRDETYVGKHRKS